MILYNMRHRGPAEYDKFTLNILQLHNESARLLGESGAEALLSEVAAEADAAFEALAGKLDGTGGGLSEELYIKMLDYKE